MNMIGERVSTYRPNDKDGEPTGMGGVVLGDVGAALYRVASWAPQPVSAES